MVAEQVIRCDICDTIIDQPGGNAMFFSTGKNSQTWSTPGGERDICGDCIAILRGAARLEMIEIDMTQFYERIGYSRDADGNWLRSDDSTIHIRDLEALAEQFRARADEQ